MSGFNFDSVVDVIKDHPLATASGVILILFFTMRSGGGGQSAGQDYSATLASMGLAYDTNVKLSDLSTQRDIAMATINSNVAVNAQQSDTALALARIQAGVQNADITANMINASNVTAAGIVQDTLGYNINVKSLINDASAIENSYKLGILSNNTDQFNIARNADNAGKQIDASFSLQKYLGDLDSNLQMFLAPFTERMNHDQQETVRNLAWRQKQIAKYQSKSNLFGSLIGGITSLGTSAIGAGAMVP